MENQIITSEDHPEDKLTEISETINEDFLESLLCEWVSRLECVIGHNFRYRLCFWSLHSKRVSSGCVIAISLQARIFVISTAWAAAWRNHRLSTSRPDETIYMVISCKRICAFPDDPEPFGEVLDSVAFSNLKCRLSPNCDSHIRTLSRIRVTKVLIALRFPGACPLNWPRHSKE
jgi:hypothetical protein